LQRCRILHFNATAHPTGDWIVQQLREALPWPCPYRYIRDAKFGGEVREFLKASGIQAVRTSIRSPWQNGVAERWVGSCRREMLDHIIPLNEQHPLRFCREYITYYHEDRTHMRLNKEAPGRPQSRIAPHFSKPGAGAASNRRSAPSVHLVDGSVRTNRFGPGGYGIA